MPEACRITDSMAGSVGHHNAHMCPSCCSGHSVTGTQVTGQSKVIIMGLPSVVIGDTGTTTCPCCGAGYTNVSGSNKVFINGIPAVRVGDATDIHGQGSGVMVTGSWKVIMA